MTTSSRFLSYIGVIALAVLLTYSISTTVAKNNEERKTSEYYQIKAFKLPGEMSFAGEKAPLDDPEVYERIERELLVNTYWQSNTLLCLKRAGKYFPIIEPILERNGIPNDFKYLCVIESGLTNASSSAGAKGFWQFMPTTATQYGLEVNDNVDERYHIEKSTEIACNYLKNAKEKLGSWALAAAAYNAGNKSITDKVTLQQVTNYYDLLLVEETARYVPRILAVKAIMENPQQYGFIVEKEELYKPDQFTTITIDTAILDLAVFAKKHSMTYKELKTLNPWLRNTYLENNNNKEYIIKIAKK